MWIVLAGPLSNHAQNSGDYGSETGKGKTAFGNCTAKFPVPSD